MWLSSLLYDAMSSELALFIPATYCRLMLGDERLSLRLPLAAAFGLLVLWLFSWRTGHGDWAAFGVVMAALGASLLRPQHASAVAQLFASPKRFLLVGAAVGVIAAVGKPLAYHLFPISELALAYSTAELFAGAALEPAAARLALISITSQLPLGVVTTNNLRAAQQRKNAMLTVGTEGGMAATKFTRLVAGASEWPEPQREAARAERAHPCLPRFHRVHRGPVLLPAKRRREHQRARDAPLRRLRRELDAPPRCASERRDARGSRG